MTFMVQVYETSQHLWLQVERCCVCVSKTSSGESSAALRVNGAAREFLAGGDVSINSRNEMRCGRMGQLCGEEVVSSPAYTLHPAGPGSASTCP